MKINLTMDNPINGYTNVCPLGTLGTIPGDIRSLDGICNDAEAVEILGENILNYIHHNDLVAALTHYVSKLRHGGKLILGGFDSYEVAKSFVLGQITLKDYNQLLHGHNGPWSIVGSYEPNEILGVLEHLGLEINKKRVNGHTFVVEAKRV